MELDTKFQEVVKAVEPATFEVKLAQITYKDELKKGEREDAPHQAVGAGKAAPDNAKSSKGRG